MNRAATICGHDGCPNVLPCPTHRRNRWAEGAPRSGSLPRGWDRTAASIRQRDNCRCWMCGNTGRTVDHLTPRSLGGTDTPDNLAVICEACDRKRRARQGAAGYWRGRR